MSPSRTTKKTAKVRFSPTPQVITSRPRERSLKVKVVRFDVESQSHSDSELEFVMRSVGTSATASTSMQMAGGSEEDADADHGLVGLWHPAGGNRTGKEKEKHPYANAKTRRSGMKRKKQVDVENNIDILVKRLQRDCRVSVRVESGLDMGSERDAVLGMDDDAMS